MLRKFGLFLLFLPAAVLAAGLFGSVHDQISYTVSQEYFTKFKFIQFRLLDASISERLRAAEVGFLASWWMGIPMGILCGVAGFLQRSASSMARALAISIPVMMLMGMGTALCGLAYGWYQTQTVDLADYTRFYIPKGLAHIRNFLCVGYMHNAAYLGGLLAIPGAWIFHLAYRHSRAGKEDRD